MPTRGGLLCYQLLWGIAIPFLKRNKRLAQGFSQRILQNRPGPADLWIQSASVGESFLALEIMKNLCPPQPVRVLLTTTTSQGIEILEKGRRDIGQQQNITIETAYFPFDHPALMAEALTTITPRLLVLLESELWPGLLFGCRKKKIDVLVINGRMTARSLARYRLWPSFWRDLRPTRILAMSPEDAGRFGELFGPDGVEEMANIKFDRIADVVPSTGHHNPLAPLLPAGAPFIVLGSVRQEEEEDVVHIVEEIRKKRNDAVIGLFPRHMHRLDFWRRRLEKHPLPWQLRSTISAGVQPGQIIVWDVMGELAAAYELAAAAFVGGSLAPLGGQNFLEPLSSGVRPVIGPSWFNFTWIGQSIFEQDLVRQEADWQGVARSLLASAAQPPDRQTTIKAISTYLARRRGGTRHACATIIAFLYPS